MTSIDTDLLRAALIGYTQQRHTIEEKIAELENLLGRGRKPKAAASSDGATSKRKPLSAAAIKHIRDAQKKRWAAFHAKEEPKAAKPKRKMSAATRKKLAANLAKARAAKAWKAAA
jgi:hypothetical protein